MIIVMVRLFCLLFVLLLGVSFDARAQSFLDTLEAEVEQERAEMKEQDQQIEAEADAQSDIPEPYIKEANLFNKHCEAKASLHAYYDCDCLTAEFLDKRIEHGAAIKRLELMRMVRRSCIDASEAAFQEYEDCKTNSMLIPGKLDPETYCSCFGNEYGIYFEKRKAYPSPDSKRSARGHVGRKCARGTYARDYYGKP